MTGTVIRFDVHAGYGTVRADSSTGDGVGQELFFHCTAIADGSREVPVGATVTFCVVPGHNGRWEAADVLRR